MKKAFTLIELIFAIVVMGILASVAIPRVQFANRNDVADLIINAINIARAEALKETHLVGKSSQWQRAYWRFGFEKCNDGGIFYYIGADRDLEGNIDVSKAEAYSDFGSNQVYMGSNKKKCGPGTHYTKGQGRVDSEPDIYISRKYGVSSAEFDCTKDTKYLAFDHYGRVHTGTANLKTETLDTIIKKPCVLTIAFDNGEEELKIGIEPETGFVHKIK